MAAAPQRGEHGGGHRSSRRAGLSRDERTLLEAIASLAGAAMLFDDAGHERFASSPGIERPGDRRALGDAMRRAALEQGRAAGADRAHDMTPIRAPAVVRSVSVEGDCYELRVTRLGAGLFGTRGAVLVTAGRAPDPTASAQTLRDRFGLTRRETEVAMLLVERRTAGEIARALGVTEYTARRHTEHVMRKLGVRTRRGVRDVLVAH